MKQKNPRVLLCVLIFYNLSHLSSAIVFWNKSLSNLITFFKGFFLMDLKLNYSYYSAFDLEMKHGKNMVRGEGKIIQF